MLLLVSVAAAGEELYGTVVRVGDGDTLTLLDASHKMHKVRLSGIDAPERRQAYGERARQHLALLTYGKSARVIWQKRDRYGRIVGRVFVAECGGPECPFSREVGLEQIKAGLAWHYKDYAREQPPNERWRYALVELQARARREGLWQDASPIPPWEFRQRPA